MAVRDREEIMLEDARIIFRNFEGKESQFNAKGKRNFAVLLSQEVAADLYEKGWNIKVLKRREDDDPDEPERPYIQVTVSFKGRPPRIVTVTSRGRTTLDEDTCALVDYADIKTADLIFRPYDWEVNGNTGRKAYLKSIFVTLNEDELDLKYADVREVSMADD